MGREIRKVPANWDHPKNDDDNYIPLHEGYQKEIGEFKAMIEKDGLEDALEYYGGGPLKEYYVEYEESEAIWFQVYETVSEGTPVTPPFETKGELIDYLVNNGTFWNKKGYSREVAEKFVKVGWVPSGMMTSQGFVSGIDCVSVMK